MRLRVRVAVVLTQWCFHHRLPAPHEASEVEVALAAFRAVRAHDFDVAVAVDAHKLVVALVRDGAERAVGQTRFLAAGLAVRVPETHPTAAVCRDDTAPHAPEPSPSREPALQRALQLVVAACCFCSVPSARRTATRHCSGSDDDHWFFVRDVRGRAGRDHALEQPLAQLVLVRGLSLPPERGPGRVTELVAERGAERAVARVHRAVDAWPGRERGLHGARDAFDGVFHEPVVACKHLGCVNEVVRVLVALGCLSAPIQLHTGPDFATSQLRERPGDHVADRADVLGGGAVSRRPLDVKVQLAGLAVADHLVEAAPLGGRLEDVLDEQRVARERQEALRDRLAVAAHVVHGCKHLVPKLTRVSAHVLFAVVQHVCDKAVPCLWNI